MIIVDASAILGALLQTKFAPRVTERLLKRIWPLRDSLTTSDGAYVVLAEALDGPLLTSDAMVAKAHALKARIDLVTN